MVDTINWLHLTDLHFGLDGEGWLWPNVKHDFFKDLDKVVDQIGGVDLVFFTGDLVQKGDVKEFTKLNKELEELWQVLSRNGATPKLCLVPGNHDLERPSSNSAITKTMTQLWWKDAGLRRTFWQDANCEYRKAVESAFANYSNWLTSLPVPSLTSKKGILPGDFSTTYSKGSANLGIVGLNTTFLQIANGDFKGKLDVHVSQLNKVCDGDPVLWLRNQAVNVLLTHQPPSWLAPDALDGFRQEIYPPGRFFSQFCGHQHEPESTEISEAGAAPRRLRQGPSLFGLENWNDVTPEKRIHGYTAGQFVFNSAGGLEKFWPRITVKGRHGGLNFAPDSTYTLQKDDCVIVEMDIDTDGEAAHANGENKIIPKTKEANYLDLQLLENSQDEKTTRSKLAGCPKINLSGNPQHKFVRLEEQSQFESEMRKSRLLWVVADWGTGKDGFLGACLGRFKEAESQLPDAFHLRCGDATDIEGFESLFPQQFGMPLQTFCSLAASLNSCFLILDEIHPALAKGEKQSALVRIARAVTDFCPNLKLIIFSRLKPESEVIPYIELRPLDIPDVRSYINSHPEATDELKDADVIEKLHDRSGGLPMHLDRMIKELKVCSLDSVLESEWEGASNAAKISEETPIALAHAVMTIAKSDARRSQRSFRLLKVLSILPYGETIESLNHYLPTEPFFPDNALQLAELALLDVIPLLQSSPRISLGSYSAIEPKSPKLLKVPRQVRDHIQTLIQQEERKEILFAGMDCFFGRGWRQSKIKLRNQPTEYREYLNSGAGNEFALIHHLVSMGREQGDESLVQKGTQIGIYYARHLKSLERYRDLATVGGALLQITNQTSHPAEWAELAALFGEGSRMLGKVDTALPYLKESLAVGLSFSDEQKASIWLDIALAEQKIPNIENAVYAANQVKLLTKPKSPVFLHAESIIAELTLSGEIRKNKLIEIEGKAQAGGHKTLAETIALNLAALTKDEAEKIRNLDKVLANKDRGYNQARAIVAKVQAVRTSSNPRDLSPADILTLCSAYSYSYAQRFSGLFDRSHDALWEALEAQGDLNQLLRLFRHSSFMWRIRGEDKKESKYLNRLHEKKVQENQTKGLIVEIRYYMQRLKIVIVDSISAHK